jgi:hypothetical protein
MPEPLFIAIIMIIGFIPGFYSLAAMRKMRSHTRDRIYTAINVSANRLGNTHPYLSTQDYHYVEGLGYMVGDLTCKFNARSAYLRCAINPSGPCKGCPHYQSIEFK